MKYPSDRKRSSKSTGSPSTGSASVPPSITSCVIGCFRHALGCYSDPNTTNNPVHREMNSRTAILVTKVHVDLTTVQTAGSCLNSIQSTETPNCGS